MARLLEDIQTLSEVSRAELIPQRANLSSMAREIAEDTSRREPQRRVAFRIQEGIIVEGDPRFLRILLGCLIGNAWKFTRGKADARIGFGVREQDGERVYFVEDNGVGFDPAYADKLFVPFQRLHPPGTFDGNGMGLATAAHVVARHGGQIRAEAIVSRGATVRFTLGTVPRSEALSETRFDPALELQTV